MKILASTYVSSKGGFLNGSIVLPVNQLDDNWLKQLYNALGQDYPKFHKMDNLSKMAFLGSELLNEFIPKEIQQENEIQLLFANSTSSQQTDLKFIDSYSNQGNPSPSLFVYTLPNIVTGELSIKNKWYGENIFFIKEAFNATFFVEQISFAFKRGNKLCLCGWVDSKMSENEECFLFLVSSELENNLETELTNLINKYRNE